MNAQKEEASEAKTEFTLRDGTKFVVEISNGESVKHYFVSPDPRILSTTVTCICTSNGKTYSTTKDCPSNQGNLCDCSTPTSPSITCG